MKSAVPNPDNATLLAALPDAAPRAAQWRLVEAAFATDAAPGGLAALVPLAGLAVFAVTFQPAWLVWTALGLTSVAVRVKLAAAFDTRLGVGEPAVWAQRHRLAAWAQAAVLGLGGLGAVLSASMPASLMVFSSIGFMAAAESACATLAGTARIQAVLVLLPAIIAGAVGGHSWGLALAGLGVLELASCILIVNRCAAQALAVTVAAAIVEEPLRAGHIPMPTGVQEFQRLLGRDQATGLPNRHGFLHILAEESRRAHDAAMPLSLILISLEGVAAADEVASQAVKQAQRCAAASAIKQSLYRVMDQMACLAPDRLAVLLPFTDALGADVVMHKICELLRPTKAETETSAAEPAFGVWMYACVGAATYAGKGPLSETFLLECAMEAEATARKSASRMARYDPLAANMRRDGDGRTKPVLAITHDPAPAALEHASEPARLPNTVSS